MTTIKVPQKLTTPAFIRLRATWLSAQNATLSYPAHISLEEVISLIKILAAQLPDEFASVVLADLVENPETPIRLVENYFESVDIGVQVAIACRPDISKATLKKCLKSENPEVIEHIVFNKTVSISDCERLLITQPNIAAKSVIRRAIQQKSKGPKGPGSN